MIIKGNWKGQYKYNLKAHPDIKGLEATNFEIEILSIVNEYFTGSVQDDLKTGGTEGIGEITGTITGNKIEFTKQMPVKTVLFNKRLGRKTFNKKHPPIYYSGTFSEGGKTVSGTWKFKFGFLWIGIFPIPMPPTSGTWTMSLIE